jgi:hypothetical protein
MATHKVFESFHVIFIESKDVREAPFRPGVVQGLNNEPAQPPEPPLAPKDTATITPNPNGGVLTTSTVTTDPVPPTPLMSPPATQPVPSVHVRRSSHIHAPSSRSAEASGASKLSAVQKATLESIASKAHIDLECKGCRSRTSTNKPTDAASNPNPKPAMSPSTKKLHNLAEVAL